jgi:hypothetical protein
MQKAIQVQTEHIVLTYLLASSIDEQLSFPARVVLQSTLSDLRKWLEEQVKIAADPYEKAHWQMAIDRFKAPEKAKPTLHAIPPPGAPIGCEDLY